MTLGKISVADYFDQNSCSHEPRTQPDAVVVRQAGHTKLGFGLNAEQEISKEVGLFAASATTMVGTKSRPSPKLTRAQA